MGSETVRVDPQTTTLLLVDIQPDFLPGGALPVAAGDEILRPVARLVETGPFRVIVATQDWHPPDHVSFASNHEGRSPLDVIELYGHEQTLWPDHCVQGTPGAALHGEIPFDRAAALIRKGTDPRCDSYSGFRNNWDSSGARPSTGLAGYLRERGTREVFVCGLARDYCVKWSAEDAAAEGFTAYVLWDLTRSVDPSADDRVRAELTDRGVRIIESTRLG